MEIIVAAFLLILGAIVFLLYNLQKLKTPEELMKRAMKETGFTDFGFEKNTKFLETVHLTLAEAHKANLKPVGRWWINFLVGRRLVERLKFVDYVKNHPELEQIQIRNPIFIIGLPRTGSTITYNLLALDNDVRTLKLWEITNPTPPPSDPATEQKRINRLKFALGFQKLWSPGLDKIHYTRPHLPEEETFWFAQNGWFPGLTIGVFSTLYQEWFLKQEDKTGDNAHQMYLDFRNLLRMRTVEKGNPSRWLFKGVLIHQHVLPALFRVFPDARVIVLRRDPCEAVASGASLETVLGNQFQQVNMKRYGPERLSMLVSLEKSTQDYRKSLPPEVESKHFVDLPYTDIVNNPFESIKKVYDQLGLEWTETFSDKMKQYLKENPKGKHGKHHYNLKQFGLTEADVRTAFEPVYGVTGPSKKSDE